MGTKDGWKGYLDIFVTFFKIGCFTFGGGYAMVPLMEEAVIDKKKWIKREEIVDLFAVSQSIPGAIAINTSTLIGYKIAGNKGALLATLGVVLPSFIVITVIASFFALFQDLKTVKAAFMGIRPAVVALILVTAVSMAKVVVKDIFGVVIMLTTVVLVVFLRVNPIVVIIGGGILGIAFYRLKYCKGQTAERKDNTR